MARIVEDVFDAALLDDAAEVHHGDVVGDFRHDAHVVRDQQHGHATADLKPFDELENFRLGGDVERGRGLVGDQDLRVGRERHGDHGALPHAAGELEGVAVDQLVGIGYLDLAQQLDRGGSGRVPVHALVQAQRLDDLRADGVHRRQRTHRLLEDEADAPAADAQQFRAALGERHDVDLPVAVAQQHPAAGDGAVFVDNAQKRAGGDALARAALADQAKRLAPSQHEADVADGVQDAGAQPEIEAEMLDTQHHVGLGGRPGLRLAAGGDLGQRRLTIRRGRLRRATRRRGN